MNKKRNPRRALVLSVFTLLLCASMLIGSTFAWFTDTASTKVSSIQSGTLNIDLVDADGNTLNNQTIGFVDDVTGKLIDEKEVKWEPGARFKLQPIKLVNEGNLAAKCKVIISAVNGNTAENGYNLADVIDVIVEGQTVGTLSSVVAAGDEMDGEFNLLPGDKEDYGTVVLMMQTGADNNYQGLSLSNIAVTVLATQAVEEHDSFNNTYDASAKFPDGHTGDVTVAPGTAKDFADILSVAFTGGSTEGVITINLDKDFDLNNEWTTVNGANYSGVNTVVINGNGHSITNLNQPLIEGVFGGAGSLEFQNLTIKDSTISAAGGAGVGIGVFMNNADASNSVTFTDCKIENVNITNTADDSTLGGFVGYSSAANLYFTNCSVIGSTFTGTKDIGALVGYTQSAVTAANVTVTGNTITSSNTSTYRVGALAGTFNSNPSTVTGTIENNTVTQANAADMSKKTSEYAGRIYADVTVNGTALTKNN